jgi:TonB family protein
MRNRTALTTPILAILFGLYATVGSGHQPTDIYQAGPYPAFTLTMRGADYDAKGKVTGLSEWTHYQSANGEWRDVMKDGHYERAMLYRLGRGAYKSTSKTGILIKGGDHVTPLPLMTAAQLRADAKFVRIETVLGLIAYVHREELEGYIYEDYLVAEMGGHRIKRTSLRPNGDKTIDEPVSLLLGEPAESDLHGPDYPVIEQHPKGNDQIAKLLLTKPDPVYPAQAIARHIEGSVSVQVTVDKEGRVVYASALSDIPHIDFAAEEAAYLAMFSPSLVDGKPAPMFGEIHYEFALPPRPDQVTRNVSDVQKQDFIHLLKVFPKCDELYCKEAIDEAVFYLPILFALTEQDLERLDIHPFALLSRGLANHAELREYVLHHLSEVRHPVLRAVWAAKLFNAGAASPEVVQFLRENTEWTPVNRVLTDMMGSQFAAFKKRVYADSPEAGKP